MYSVSRLVNETIVRPMLRQRPESARPRPRPKNCYETETKNYETETETSLVNSVAYESNANRYAFHR